MFTGEEEEEGGVRTGMKGRQRRAGIIQRRTIPQGFSVFAVKIHKDVCPLVCELLQDPCELNNRDGASIPAPMEIKDCDLCSH